MAAVFKSLRSRVRNSHLQLKSVDFLSFGMNWLKSSSFKGLLVRGLQVPWSEAVEGGATWRCSWSGPEGGRGKRWWHSRAAAGRSCSPPGWLIDSAAHWCSCGHTHVMSAWHPQQRQNNDVLTCLCPPASALWIQWHFEVRWGQLLFSSNDYCVCFCVLQKHVEHIIVSHSKEFKQNILSRSFERTTHGPKRARQRVQSGPGLIYKV